MSIVTCEQGGAQCDIHQVIPSEVLNYRAKECDLMIRWTLMKTKRRNSCRENWEAHAYYISESLL